MSKPGINRFVITGSRNGRGSWRFIESEKRWPGALKLFPQIFDDLGAPLLPGHQEIQCTKEEFFAGYDYALGIDLELNFESGMSSTLQSKFLFDNFRTVTVEYMQDHISGEEGDWFNLKAQFYFVGYDRIGAYDGFQDWILLNWPATQKATSQNLINWQERENQRDGARASFRYANFEEFPDNCIVAYHDTWSPPHFKRRDAIRAWKRLAEEADRYKLPSSIINWSDVVSVEGGDVIAIRCLNPLHKTVLESHAPKLVYLLQSALGVSCRLFFILKGDSFWPSQNKDLYKFIKAGRLSTALPKELKQQTLSLIWGTGT